MDGLRDLFFLDPTVAFLNHGSFGSTPRPVLAACQAWQARLERQPVQFFVEELPDRLAEARARLGPGDEVLATDHEYGGCDRTLAFVCEKSGARYVRQHVSIPPRSEDSLVEEFWQAVTPRTRLIFFSHITSPTALTFPVQAICRRARRAGIPTLVDGAHAPGQIELDISSLEADFYAGNCHKWLMAPKGAGFLFARREVQAMLEPLVVSWGWRVEPWFTTGSRFIDLYQWRGTYDPCPCLSVLDALRFLEDHDWPAVRADCHRLLDRALIAVNALTGLPPMHSVPESPFHQMGIAELPTLPDPAVFKHRLYEEHRVEVPLMEWDGRAFLRVSVQGYNTEQDIERLLAGLKALLAEMA